MDDDLRRWLFDPAASHDLVVAHRPPVRTAVTCVVSDVVWGEVVCLLRWANAGTGGSAGLETGTWWRLAAGCAALLRRFPGLSAEIDEPWAMTAPPDSPDAASGADRVAEVAGRLAGHLRSGQPMPLRALAAEVDALGAAALTAVAERWSGRVPEPARPPRTGRHRRGGTGTRSRSAATSRSPSNTAAASARKRSGSG